ncbi:MAG: uL15 family ribosomal protein [Candidatus Diapherotrites archaeon]|nr:uL15 family ribosomal protein [Candidatus Diapherotrites archaeon]
MVVRKRRKKNRLRGNRTHGGGNTKRRRGSGSRGGVGFAGSHKHKFSKYYTKFGKKITLKTKEGKKKAMPAWKIEELAKKFLEEGKAKKEGDNIIIDGKDLGIYKIIGPGEIPKNVIVRNVLLSKKFKQKEVEG